MFCIFWKNEGENVQKQLVQALSYGNEIGVLWYFFINYETKNWRTFEVLIQMSGRSKTKLHWFLCNSSTYRLLDQHVSQHLTLISFRLYLLLHMTDSGMDFLLLVEHWDMPDFILYIAFTCTLVICVVKLQMICRISWETWEKYFFIALFASNSTWV